MSFSMWFVFRYSKYVLLFTFQSFILIALVLVFNLLDSQSHYSFIDIITFSALQARRKRSSNTYQHIQGCDGTQLVSCGNGYSCGNGGSQCSGQSCTLDYCKNYATDNNYDGFAYKPSGNFGCKMCTFEEIVKYGPETDYGVYSSVTGIL